jgi:hypothetical protein
MKLKALLLVLTVANVAMLATTIASTGNAAATRARGVLRGRGLEIVDAKGHIRASIEVIPADPTASMPDGSKGYPEPVLLRLITADGRPNVKLGADERGSALVLGGRADPTYPPAAGRRGRRDLTLKDGSGRTRTLRP